MKKLIIITVLFIFFWSDQASAQEPVLNDDSTTTVVPEGLKLRKGKLYIAKGYQGKVSKDGKKLTVSKMNNTGGAGGGSSLIIVCKCIAILPLACGVILDGEGGASCSVCNDRICAMFVGTSRPDESGIIRYKKLIISTN